MVISFNFELNQETCFGVWRLLWTDTPSLQRLTAHLAAFFSRRPLMARRWLRRNLGSIP